MTDKVKHVGLADITSLAADFFSTAISVIIVGGVVFGFFLFAYSIFKARNEDVQGFPIIMAILVSLALASLGHVFGFSISWFK